MKKSFTIVLIASIMHSIFWNNNWVGIGSIEHDFGEEDKTIDVTSFLESDLKLANGWLNNAQGWPGC